MEMTQILEKAFDYTSQTIGGVSSDQLGDATPCSQWNVGELIDHMVSVVNGLAAAASKTPPAEIDIAADRQGAFDDASSRALAA